MKRTLGNYLTQPDKDFPLDAETLESLQQNQTMLAVLGNIAGDKTILWGCEPEQNGTRRKAGYIFLRTQEFPEGEVLYWEGGSVASDMHVRKEAVAVTSHGYEFPQAYTVRSLAPGVGSEEYRWSEMKELCTLPQLDRTIDALRAEIAVLTPPPLGVVQLWAGTEVPAGYLLCDGQSLKIDDYPELYAAIGTTFNRTCDSSGQPCATAPGHFRLPDLRGRFVVGYDPNDTDYDACGNTGGEKEHTLTEAEMPAHTHDQYLWKPANDNWKSGGKASPQNATSWHDQTTQYGTTGSKGGSTAHENRPPYYALAYIMRIK